MNQDVALENLFSQIRTQGGLDGHPTPLNALYRLRMIMLGKDLHIYYLLFLITFSQGKSPGIVQEHTNYTHASSKGYVVSTVIKEAHIKPHIEPVQNVGIDDPELSSLSEMSTALSDTASNNLQLELHIVDRIERDGLDYFGGWLAKKISQSYPHLGDYTYMLQREYDYCLPSWVKHVSYEGLTELSPQLKSALEILNEKFNKINKKSLRIKKRVVTRLTKKLKTYVDIPVEVTRAFVQQRTFVRMKFLNIKLTERKTRYNQLRKLKKRAT